MSNKSLVAVLLVSVIALSAPAMAAAPGQGTVATDHRLDVQQTDQPMSTSHQPDRPGGAEQAAAPDQFDPNDDFNNSTPVEPGNYTNLSISSGDADVFTFDAAADSVFAAAITFSHAEGNLDMALYGPNRTALASSNSTTDRESITTLLPETGTYYLVVYGFENATARYDLLLTFTPSETGTETANNTTAAGNVRPPVVD